MQLGAVLRLATSGALDVAQGEQASRDALTVVREDVVDDVLLGKPGDILLIIVVAAVVHLLVRRAITRFTKSIVDPDTAKTLTKLRGRAPAAVRGSSLLADRATARAQTLAQVLRSLATVLIWSIAVVTILGELDIRLGPIIAGAGIAGVALGFGAQSLVRDFLTGFFMLAEDQLGVGDIVDLGEAVGTVEEVSLRTTRVRDVNGTLWHVPNGEIQRVANLSQEWSRALLDIGVAYDTDVEMASGVIKETADEMWRDPAWRGVFVEEPEVWGVQDFGPNEIIIRLVVKTEPAEQWRVMRELRFRIWKAFERDGIEIPFPQRTIWVRREGGAPELAESPELLE